MKLVHWPLMCGLLHLVQHQAHPRCTKCNSPPINSQCTSHRIAVYSGPLLCGFNVPIKGLINVNIIIFVFLIFTFKVATWRVWYTFRGVRPFMGHGICTLNNATCRLQSGRPFVRWRVVRRRLRLYKAVLHWMGNYKTSSSVSSVRAAKSTQTLFDVCRR